MCIGIPMQVLTTFPSHAKVSGRGEERMVDTQLVGTVQPGDWLLVFLDAARECISPERAAEVNATLDLVASAFAPTPGLDPGAAAAFDLPSALSADQIAALTGARP